MIRERPILFSDAMVKAILEGRKTQTRRILNPQPVECEKGLSWHTRQKEVRLGGGGLGVCGGADSAWRAEEVKRFAAQRCAYGSPGDRLYVRETFSGPHEWTDIPPAGWGWDGSHVPIWYWADGNPECGDWTRPKPGIHLPKRYSRITLEITDVRVQRLQEIMRRNTFHNMPEPLPELVLLRGRLNRKINKRTRAHEEQDGRPA
jgi:hypothetical protein